MQDVNKRAVILLSDCQETHFLTLINLGESLIAEGIETTFLVCAHGPCPGSTDIFRDVIDYSCVWQRAKIISALRERSLKFMSLHDCVDEKLIEASRANLQIPVGDDYEKAEYRGYNLWDIAKGSICRYLLRTTVSANDLPVIMRYFSAVILHLDTFPRLYSLLQPDILIIFNGMALLDRVAREVAVSMGIMVFAEENSCFADRKFLDPTGVILNRHLFAQRETWESIRDFTLTDEQHESLSLYLEGVYAGRLNTVSQCVADSQNEILGKLGFKAGQPIAILLAQVPVDSVIVFDSPIYTDIIDFIHDVMNIFAKKPDWGLIVRLHPIEERLFGSPTLRRLLESPIPENVRIVHGSQLNTYGLMDCSRFALTINSQAGLEMLSKHRPVIVAGTAFYGDKGFTSDVHSREELDVVVEKLCATTHLGKRQADLVDLFLYHFIFEYLLPYDRLTYSFGPEATARIKQALLQCSRPLFSSFQQTTDKSGGGSIAQKIQNLYLLGMQGQTSGHLDDALNAFRMADSLAVHGLPEERIPLILPQIEILIEQYSYDEVETLVHRLAEVRVNAGSTYYDLLFHVYSRRNNDMGVRRSLLKLLEVNPESHYYRFELGVSLEKKGRYKAAFEQFRELIHRCPDHLDAFFHLERTRKKAGYEQNITETKLNLSHVSVKPYIKSVVQSVRNGDIVDVFKRLYVISWLICQRLRNL